MEKNEGDIYSIKYLDQDYLLNGFIFRGFKFDLLLTLSVCLGIFVVCLIFFDNLTISMSSVLGAPVIFLLIHKWNSFPEFFLKIQKENIWFAGLNKSIPISAIIKITTIIEPRTFFIGAYSQKLPRLHR